MTTDRDDDFGDRGWAGRKTRINVSTRPEAQMVRSGGRGCHVTITALEVSCLLLRLLRQQATLTRLALFGQFSQSTLGSLTEAPRLHPPTGPRGNSYGLERFFFCLFQYNHCRSPYPIWLIACGLLCCQTDGRLYGRGSKARHDVGCPLEHHPSRQVPSHRWRETFCILRDSGVGTKQGKTKQEERKNNHIQQLLRIGSIRS
jgi:hypothetical protein